MPAQRQAGEQGPRPSGVGSGPQVKGPGSAGPSARRCDLEAGGPAGRWARIRSAAPSSGARRAASFFEEGFRVQRRGRGRLGLEEHLFFLSESASLLAVTGKGAKALRRCEEGLRLAGRKRSAAVREGVLALLATRAAVRMRRLECERAIRDFEAALQMAEAIGSPANQAVILNNLATVYANSDRYGEAIRAYREAESLSLRLEEGPSLVTIYGNLAVLSAKTGDSGA